MGAEANVDYREEIIRDPVRFYVAGTPVEK